MGLGKGSQKNAFHPFHHHISSSPEIQQLEVAWTCIWEYRSLNWAFSCSSSWGSSARHFNNFFLSTSGLNSNSRFSSLHTKQVTLQRYSCILAIVLRSLAGPKGEGGGGTPSVFRVKTSDQLVFPECWTPREGRFALRFPITAGTWRHNLRTSRKPLTIPAFHSRTREKESWSQRLWVPMTKNSIIVYVIWNHCAKVSLCGLFVGTQKTWAQPRIPA